MIEGGSVERVEQIPSARVGQFRICHCPDRFRRSTASVSTAAAVVASRLQKLAAARDVYARVSVDSAALRSVADSDSLGLATALQCSLWR